MLPYFLPRHVVLAAKVNYSFVIGVAAFECRWVGLAVVESCIAPPHGIRPPCWISNDDFLPVINERVGKYQFAAAGFVNNLLLSVPCCLGTVGCAFFLLPLRVDFRVA